MDWSQTARAGRDVGLFVDWLPGSMKDGATEDKRSQVPWPKGKSQQGELRLNAARKSPNNMVLMVRLKLILKHLSNNRSIRTSLHGGTHAVSVEWDSEGG